VNTRRTVFAEAGDAFRCNFDKKFAATFGANPKP
jgi:hypothetical protein